MSVSANKYQLSLVCALVYTTIASRHCHYKPGYLDTYTSRSQTYRPGSGFYRIYRQCHASKLLLPGIALILFYQVVLPALEGSTDHVCFFCSYFNRPCSTRE